MRVITIIVAAILTIGLVSCNNNKNEGDVEKTSSEPDIHSSKISLDWAGIYFGTVPCADCEGINTQIRLHENGKYSKMTQYKGKDGGVFMETGHFEWDDTGSNVTLISEEEDKKSQYKVMENSIKMLDLSGNEIEGGLADLYVLSKKFSEFEGSKWRLVKIMGKDVEMTESGKNFPFITFNPDNDRFSGNSSCNNFSGEYMIDKGLQIELSKMAVTKKACIDMSTEAQFIGILNKVDNFNVNSEKLTLNKARMAPLAEFEPIYFD